MQQQQNKVLKFHLSCKIFIVLEGEIHCNMQLLLKAKTRKRDSALSGKIGRNLGFPIVLNMGFKGSEYYTALKWTHMT